MTPKFIMTPVLSNWIYAETWKDIVIPPFIGESVTQRHSPSLTVRRGIYFRGARQFHRNKYTPGYGRGVRETLFKVAALVNDTSVLSINEGHSDDYLVELEAARFCVAPPGFAPWSPRLAESVLIGCIPGTFISTLIIHLFPPGFPPPFRFNAYPWSHSLYYTHR